MLMNTLSPHEKERYSRQILLEEIGDEGQQKLKEAKVLIVGAGGLGSPFIWQEPESVTSAWQTTMWSAKAISSGKCSIQKPKRE